MENLKKVPHHELVSEEGEEGEDIGDLRSVDSNLSEEKGTGIGGKKKNTLKGLIYGFGAATCYGLLICAVKWLY